MSKVINAGIVTAYGAAVRGGYQGTYEQFCADLGQLAEVLSEFLGFSVTVETLAEGVDATASYNGGVLALGIPRGNTGNGIQSIVLNADYTLTVTYTNGQTWTSESIRGETGVTPRLTIGTVQTLEPGQSASAEITGTPEDPVLNLGIPQGETGASDAGAVTYNPETAYNDGTVGKAVSNLSRHLKDVSGDVTQLKTALSDLDDRVDILEALEKGRGFTPEQLQTIAASGHANEYFEVGDIIYIDWTDYTPATPVTYHVPHVVTHFGEIEDENGVKHQNAMYLMWMYATPQTIQFDHPEEIIATEATFTEEYYYYIKNGSDWVIQEVTYGDPIPAEPTYYHHVRSGIAGRIRYGSNDWSQSAYRQWLNSADGKGEWWTAQHESDVAPDQAATVPGFLTGYSSDWLAIFKPVKVQTALNTVCDGGVTVTTYDKFFLPSLEQMYGNPQAKGVEGEFWEYWKNELGLDAPMNGSSSNTNDARKIPSITAPSGAAVYVRLRSAYRSSTYYVWIVSTAGYLNSYGAGLAYRAQPACVIY